MKIMIFGGSGCGKTTLAKEIAKQTDFIHLDSDDYYWKKTTIPFQEKVPLQERNQRIRNDFKKAKNTILSGCMLSWGEEWKTAFDLAIFMEMDNTERMHRLQKREIERYGKRLETDEELKKSSEAFLDWANQYDNPDFHGTTIKVHTKWIELLDCKVLRLDGNSILDDNVQKVLFEIENHI